MHTRRNAHPPSSFSSPTPTLLFLFTPTCCTSRRRTRRMCSSEKPPPQPLANLPVPIATGTSVTTCRQKCVKRARYDDATPLARRGARAHTLSVSVSVSVSLSLSSPPPSLPLPSPSPSPSLSLADRHARTHKHPTLARRATRSSRSRSIWTRLLDVAWYTSTGKASRSCWVLCRERERDGEGLGGREQGSQSQS
jgi:hypothetical protein